MKRHSIKIRLLWGKNDDLKEVAALPVHDDKYIKIKVKTYPRNIIIVSYGQSVSEDKI